MVLDKNSIIGLFLVLQLFACDADKYLSSNLNMVEGLDSTSVFGRVLRFDNRKSVSNAYVQFGYNWTITDTNGRFELGLTVNNDDNRNLSTPIIVSAPKYIDYYSQYFVSYLSQDFEFILTWRPPILYKAALLNNADMHIVQALVKDFEGVGNIDTVYCFLYLLEEPNQPAKRHEFPMRFQFKVDNESAFYQSDIFSGTIPSGGGRMYVTIIAADKYSYRDTLAHIHYQMNPDPPIYPVDWNEGKLLPALELE